MPFPSGVRHPVQMESRLGDHVSEALAEMVRTADALPGAFKAEFTLTYWASVIEPGESWLCTVEGDIQGDDGSSFSVLGHTAEEALMRAAEEAWRRVP